MARTNENHGNASGHAAQIKEGAQQVQQGLRDAGAQVRDAAGEQFQNLREQASEYYEQGRQRAHEWEEGIERYVQEKPIQSLLIAAGVGMLLGILWKRS